MKMSAQDLSRPAFVFYYLPIVFEASFREAGFGKEKPMRYSQEMQPSSKQIGSPYRWAFVAFVVCALFAACGLLDAQTGATGAITGAVADPTGAMVVGAQVKVTNVATGDTRTAQTNDHGLYVVSLLPPGQFKLEVTKQGFKVASSPSVTVIVAETTALNIRMEPGAVTETVTVASSNEQLQTESSQLGRVTDTQMLENLPLVTRNFTQIIGLNPGVNQEANNAGLIGKGNGSQDASPAGGSLMSQGGASTDNHFEMNGITINDIQGSWIYSAGIPSPNPDTIQEFKVQTALFDASSGRNAGADVNVITKGGTNDYHATLFEFFRNEDLNGNDWFAKSLLQPRPILRQNQYGLTAGGPLVKNNKKILLFGSWQGTKQFNAQDPSCHKLVQVPPLTDDRSAAGLGAALAGDEGYLGIYGGQVNANGTVTYYPGTPFAYSLPIAPQAVALFQAKLPNGQYMIPTPSPQNIDTSKALEDQGTVFISQPGFFDENQWMVNADYLRSDRHKIAFRYFGATSNEEWTALYSTLGNGLYQPERYDVGSVADTFILSPNLVNQFVVGLHRSMSNQTYNNAFTFSSLGMNAPAEDDNYPNIWVFDAGFETGTTSALYFLQDEYVANDTLSWVKGKHQLTFGGGYTFGRDDMAKFAFEAYFLPLTWEDFLAGQANAGFTGYSNIWEIFEGIGDLERDWRYRQGNAFIQDDFKVTQRLTLNLGFRYEFIGNMSAAASGGNGGGNVDVAALNPQPPAAGSLDGLMVTKNFSLGALPAGVIRAGNNSALNNQGENTINPRLGFAWTLPGSDRFVLRGGIGMYHTTTEAQMNLQLCNEQPTGAWVVLIGANNGASSDANPFPAPPAFPQWVPYSPSTEDTMDSLALNWRPPTTYHYSLGLQSRLPGGPVLDVAYAGARDLHLVFDPSLDQARLASPESPINYYGTSITTNTVANINERKPYQGWATSEMLNDQTSMEAWYSSLQASLTQKFRHSLQYQASFTWSRLLSPVPGFTIGSNEIGPIGDQTATRAHESGYGPDYNMRPLRFVLSVFYALPSPAKSHTLLADTLGGWSLATATLVQDGQQGSITITNTNNAYGITADRASYAPGCNKNTVSTPGSISSRVKNGKYINTACFVEPAVLNPSVDPQATGFGNTPNGILREPDQANIDLSLSKSLQVNWPKEGASVQLRSDFFNALNHPNFGEPNSVAGTGTFGVITGMSTNPRVIQFSLKYAF
jgi:hypothetical protein